MERSLLVVLYIGVALFGLGIAWQLLTHWRMSRYTPMLAWTLVMILSSTSAVLQALAQAGSGWTDPLVRAEWIVRGSLAPGLLVFATNSAMHGPDRTWLIARWTLVPLVTSAIALVTWTIPLGEVVQNDPLRPAILLWQAAEGRIVILLWGFALVYLGVSFTTIVHSLRGLDEFADLRESVLGALLALFVAVGFAGATLLLHRSPAAPISPILNLLSQASATVILGVSLRAIGRLESNRVRTNLVTPTPRRRFTRWWRRPPR